MQAWVGDKVKPEEAFPMLKYLDRAEPGDDDPDPVEAAHAMMRAVGVR